MRATAEFDWTNEAAHLAAARQLRAEHVWMLFARRFGWRIRPRILVTVIAAVLAGAALTIASAPLLSREGVAASVPASACRIEASR